MAITILPIEEPELPLLGQIARQTFEDAFGGQNTAENMLDYLENAFNPSQIKGEFENPKNSFFLLRMDDQPAGYLKLSRSDGESKTVEIERIYIEKRFQGRGLGRLLMEKALATSKSEGYDTLTLGVWEHNTNAINFYKKAGFTIVSSKTFKLGDDEQTDYIMELKLGDSAASWGDPHQ